MNDPNWKGINPNYPPLGEDAALDLMRSMGVPDPGTPEVEPWIYEHIVSASDDDYYDPDDDCSTHDVTCACEDCMQTYPERFDEDWNNIYYVEDQP